MPCKESGLNRKQLPEVKPHRHPYGMPPPLVGAALAKRASFTPCQGLPY